MSDGSISTLDRKSIQTIPATSGVYLFKHNHTYIYIGKSVNLRARLLSHLENAKTDAKEAAIFQSSNRIEYTITDSEFKALIYEARLIRNHKPHYNVRWRDDKSYLYICITTHDLYPKISLSRLRQDPSLLSIGPFSSSKVALRLIAELRKIIPFCTQKRITSRRCFYSKIGLCNPCPSAIEHLADHDKKTKLQKLYRQQVRALIRILEGKSESLRLSCEKKIRRYTRQERYEEAIPYRNMLTRLEGLLMRKLLHDDPDEINASATQIIDLLALLKKFFPTMTTLKRIECYDMSTFAFRDSTASMVVFSDGVSNKQEYRRFKIKNIRAESDFEMFEEVMQRRFRESWPRPDLIVVDGGKPQVRTVLRIFHARGIAIPLIGIAKRPDRIIIGSSEFTCLRPPRDHKGFLLLEAMRDEAHRFAKKYHVHLREKKMML